MENDIEDLKILVKYLLKFHLGKQISNAENLIIQQACINLKIEP